jgi:ergothioneine biosynthesis protein EgtB
MPDVSPIRWHIAHTTWFFETFVLKKFAEYVPVSNDFEYLFNSYYTTVGDPFPRDRRGLLSRPTLAEIFDYRAKIDEEMIERLGQANGWNEDLLGVVELGLHHEQQHQELMLADIKHVFSCNPLYPAFVKADLPSVPLPEQIWISFQEGLHQIGHDGDGFAFDNESPRHRVFVEPFELSSRLVTNGEFRRFVLDEGYRRPEFWLSLGWDHVCQFGWEAPLYWKHSGDQWHEFSLGGMQPLDPSLPVTHVSYFEADAYARWAGARLATEAEWEIAAMSNPISGMSAEDYFDLAAPVHPTHSGECGQFRSLGGSVWQWTSSSYSPYPGYRPTKGALGEYNGKFMCNQYVLRGSSCATSKDHTRQTYRNFFPPEARWQFSGIRLARG